MVRVVLPSLLDSYTEARRELELEATTLAEAFAALEARFPGLRFRLVDEQGRLRRHINAFVGGQLVRDLQTPLAAGQTLQLVGALSGG